MEEHHSKKVEHKKKSSKVQIKKADLWMYTAIIAIVLLVVSVVTGGFGAGSGISGAISVEEASNSAVAFINDNLLEAGNTAQLNSFSEGNGIYVMDLTIGGQDYTSYVSKDGKLLFTSGIDMTEEIEAPIPEGEAQAQAAPEVIKSDKPEVELFVMSHCPFGTQAEKGIIPAVNALGDDIDFKLRFVYYAMHPSQGEVEEQLNQYCIQKEQDDKFLDYLECFLTEGDGEGCLVNVGIDQPQLNACTKAADEEFEILDNLADQSKWLSGRYPMFNTDAELNEKYGVGGSPTLVINGRQASSGRDSVSFLNTICGAFNDAPESCNTKLDAAQPSSGFGYTTTAGATTTAGCGV